MTFFYRVSFPWWVRVLVRVAGWVERMKWDHARYVDEDGAYRPLRPPF